MNHNKEKRLQKSLQKLADENPKAVKALLYELDLLRKEQKDIGWSKKTGLYDKGTLLPIIKI